MTRLLRTASTAALIIGGTVLGTPAFSQSGPVTVDLSVLDDNGYGPATAPGYAGGSGELLMPGPATPKSSYFGPSVTVSNPILSAPSTPVVSEMDSQMDSQPDMQADLQAALQADEQASLTTADSVPPPPPEPAAVTTAAVSTEETASTGMATTPAVPEAPETPEEPAASSVSSGSAAVALEPAIPAAPEAPDVTETTTTSTEPSTTSTDSAPATASTTEVASTSSMASGMAASAHALQIVFGEADSKLPGGAETELNAIAEKLKDTDNYRIQLLAYAGGESLSASKARRLSLSRALSVRSFFIENGVRSTRIDVRALGDKTDEQPVNRVDINIIER